MSHSLSQQLVDDIPAEYARGPFSVAQAMRQPLLSAPTSSVEDLLAWLAEWNLPLEAWGQGQAKQPQSLLRELREGACRLFVLDPFGPRPRLCRFSLGSTVGIGHVDTQGQARILVEDRQEFTDGRENPIKKRGFRFVGEKAEPGETPEQTAHRALAEELSLPPFELTYIDQRQKYGESLSYPGLVSWYVFDRFVGMMPASLYRPEGYVEEQGDKRSVFLWEAV